MKKLLLAALVAATSLLSQANNRITTHYDQSDKWSCVDGNHLRAYFAFAAVAAKYVVYTFDESETDNYILLLAYNDDCSFFLRYDKIYNECTVEFNTCDDSFSYCFFKKTLDTFFLNS